MPPGLVPADKAAKLLKWLRRSLISINHFRKRIHKLLKESPLHMQRTFLMKEIVRLLLRGICGEDMNSEKLLIRLESVAKYIPQGSRIADIGSDHAYLPCYVVQKGVTPFAIAGEQGPVTGSANATTSISRRMTCSLKLEVDLMTIAGMGGALIASILEAGKEKLEDVQCLVLQPNIGAKSIRTWLLKNGWGLIAEEILEEDGKIYEVLVAERGKANSAYEQEKEKERKKAYCSVRFCFRKKMLLFAKSGMPKKKIG